MICSCESEQEKPLFDSILLNSIGRTEGDMEKKLRETSEWIIEKTDGPSCSTGKNISEGGVVMDSSIVYNIVSYGFWGCETTNRLPIFLMIYSCELKLSNLSSFFLSQITSVLWLL